MKRTSTTALAFCLLLGFIYSVTSADELISKSGAAVTFFAPGYEAYHLNSQYSGGIVLGEDFAQSKAVYEFYVPGNEGAQRLISSMTIRITGSGSITNLIVGSTIVGRVSGNWSRTLNGADVDVALGHAGDIVKGDALRIQLDVLSGPFGGDRYDLEKIEVTYIYVGADAGALDNFHTAYSAYKSITAFKREVVYGIWDKVKGGEMLDDTAIINRAKLIVGSLCLNLLDLDKNLFSAMLGFFSVLEDIQDMTDLCYVPLDYLYLSIAWFESEETTDAMVAQACDNAATACAALATAYQELGFDGIDCTGPDSEATKLLAAIEEARGRVADLQFVLNGVRNDLQWACLMHPDWAKQVKVALKTLSPFMSYDPNTWELSSDSYIPQLINDLDQQKGQFVAVTVNASPSDKDLKIKVDGVEYTNTVALHCRSGSSHTLEAYMQQTGNDGKSYTFEYWSDGGLLAHTVTPTSDVQYTAVYHTASGTVLIASDDAMISERYPDTNFGANPWMYVNGDRDNASDGLIKFNTSAIPAGSIVHNVELRIFTEFYALSNPISLHQIASSWKESSVTWNTRPDIYLRVVADCKDFGDIPLYSWRSTDYPTLKTVAQEWVDTPSSNYGLWINNCGLGVVSFYTSESSSDKRPQLVVDYTVLTGSVNVTIDPSEARNAGAQWRVDGGTWHNSGYTQGGLSVGLHTVEFKSLSGWDKPSDKPVQINLNQITYENGTYTRQIGSLTVSIEPVEARIEGAQWRVDGGTWHSSGDTQSDLYVAQHTVEFKSIPEWQKPGNMNVMINQGDNSASGTYTLLCIPQKLLRNPSMEGYFIDGVAAYWRGWNQGGGSFSAGSDAHEGSKSQAISASASGVWECSVALGPGGMYEKICPLQPGQVYRFTAWFKFHLSTQEWPELNWGAGEVTWSIGADPCGGTDPNAVTNWVNESDRAPDYWWYSYQSYDSDWTKVTMFFVAKEETTTIFAQLNGWAWVSTGMFPAYVSIDATSYIDDILIKPINIGQGSAVEATSPVSANGNSYSKVTITVLDADGNPIEHISPSDIVVNCSGSDNSIIGPNEPTDANGQTTARITSTVSETKIVNVTVLGKVLTDNATVWFGPPHFGPEWHVNVSNSGYQNGSPDSPFNSISEAIIAANAGHAIIVEPGTYYQKFDFAGKAITIRGSDPNDWDMVAATVIDANGSGSAVTFQNNEGPNSVLSGLTITGGKANNGGGIYCVGTASPTLTNCNITNNVALANGGGIYGSKGTITNCIFIANFAGSSGGAMCDCDGTIVDCTLSGNSAGNSGGALYACDGSVVNCTFTENTSNNSGGAISSCSSKIFDCFFAFNSAKYGNGGAIFGGNPVLWRCTFMGNWAKRRGGAMHNAGASPTINSCLFSGNWASDGGAMFNDNSSPILTNCTLSGNAAWFGGGMCNIDGTQTITNCILWMNSDGWGTDELAQIDGGTPLVTFSCIQDDDPNDTNVPFGGTDSNNIDDDPRFVCNPDDGGDGWSVGNNDDFGDLHLLEGSPCIDKGDPNYVVDVNGLDVYGGPRFIGGRIDMGADEFIPGEFSDLNKDKIADFNDYAIFANYWLQDLCTAPAWCEGCDINHNGKVDFVDLMAFLENWLWQANE